MTNTIRFLEALGGDANAPQMTPETYAETVSALDVDESSRRALLERNIDALSTALGGRAAMQLVLVPAEDDDEGEQPDDDQDDSDEIRMVSSRLV